MKSNSLVHYTGNAIVSAVFALFVLLVIIGNDKQAILLSANPSVMVQEQSTRREQFSRLEAEQIFRDYTVRIYRNDDTDDSPLSVLQILRNGEIVHRLVGFRFYLGHAEGAREYDRLIPIGTDITGKGIPNLVVSEWSGGAHCCFMLQIFELGQEFKAIATIDSQHSDTSHFERRGNYNGLVFRAYDFAFAYWRTSFAESPAPKVILRYCNGDYRLADDLMRRPAPSRYKLSQLSRNIRNDFSWREGTPSPQLWGSMLDLIYSGNDRSAWDLLDMAWPVKLSGKTEFLKEFQEQLASSAYWKQIKLLNAGKPVCGAPQIH